MSVTNFPNGVDAPLKHRGGDVLASAAAGEKKVAKGSATLTGSSGDIATGLTTVEQVVVTMRTAPVATAAGPFLVTATRSGGNITINAWGNTAVAATAAADVDWVAIGT